MDLEREKVVTRGSLFSLAYKLLYSKHSQTSKREKNTTALKEREIQWIEEKKSWFPSLLSLRKGKDVVACLRNSWATKYRNQAALRNKSMYMQGRQTLRSSAVVMDSSRENDPESPQRHRETMFQNDLLPYLRLSLRV